MKFLEKFPAALVYKNMYNLITNTYLSLQIFMKM